MARVIADLENQLVEAMGRFAKDIGIVGVSEGRVLGRLVLSNRPLTQDEIMELSGASRGNVSTALKTLMEGGFARKVWVKGSRKEHYEAVTDLWRVTLSFMLDRMSRQITAVHEEFLELLADGIQLKKNGESAAERRAASRLVQRVELLTGFTAGGRNLVDTVRKLIDRNKT